MRITVLQYNVSLYFSSNLLIMIKSLIKTIDHDQWYFVHDINRYFTRLIFYYFCLSPQSHKYLFCCCIHLYRTKKKSWIFQLTAQSQINNIIIDEPSAHQKDGGMVGYTKGFPHSPRYACTIGSASKTIQMDRVHKVVKPH